MSNDATQDAHPVAGRPRLHGFDAVFSPRSVAIVGASSHQLKIGGRPIHHMKSHGFDGAIYPINPNYDEVQGVKAYPSLTALPEVPDLAVVAVPGPAVMEAVRECADAGVKAVVLFSAGFAEAGEEGERQQVELTRIAATSGMRIIGPNCIGAANMVTGALPTFAAAVMIPRDHVIADVPRIALVSQSGALGGHCVALAANRGFEFTPWITTGNECDVDVADSIAYFAKQDDVSAIAVYMEGCKDGRRLQAALASARRRRKPVIMLKAGVSDVGAAAASSHTASLVGSDDAYHALFRQYDVCRVTSVSELMDLSHALALGGLPRGGRAALFTGSGGAGILMADAAEEAGLQVPPLPVEVQQELKRIWPPAGVTNPIDTTAQVTNDPALFPAFLNTVIDGTDYDTVLVFLTYLGLMEPWATTVVDSLWTVREAHPEAHIMVSSLTSPETARALNTLGMPHYEDLRSMVETAGRLARLGAALSAPMAEEFHPLPVSPAPLTGELTEDRAKAILSDAGIPTVPDRVVQSATDAVSAAEELGYPVVLKIVSPDIAHKSEVGGVRLGLADAAQVEAAHAQIIASAQAAVPQARLSGVLVTPMVSGGVETILGVKNDPSLGMTVAFGLGGVFVEVLQDVTLRLAPFDVKTAAEMIRDVRGFELLDGARGTEPADTEALARALSNLSVFAAAHADSIESIDVNPFVVLPRGQGAFALDALISTHTPGPEPTPEPGPPLRAVVTSPQRS